MNQSSVEKAVLGTSDQLEDATLKLGKLTVTAAEAKVNYKRKYAMVYMSLSDAKTVAEREQRTHQQLLVEYRDMELGEAQVKAQQELCRTLRARLDAYRTVSANLRVQV